MLKKTSIVLALSLAFNLGTLAGARAADAQVFTDVSNSYWAHDSIVWAKTNGIVDGYEDGSFRPESTVKEEEFLKMLVSAYEPNLSDVKGGWQAKYYTYAKDHQWEVVGNVDASRQAQKIDRFSIARVIVNATGSRFYTSRGYVDELYRLGLSEGRTAKTYEGYQGSGGLTRAEAVTFIQRLKTSLSSLKKAEFPAQPAGVPKLDNDSLKQQVETFVKANTGLKAIAQGENPNSPTFVPLGFLIQKTGEAKQLSLQVNTVFQPFDSGFAQWQAIPALFASADLTQAAHQDQLYDFLKQFFKDELTLSKTELKMEIDKLIASGKMDSGISFSSGATLKLPHLYLDLQVTAVDNKPSRVNVWVYLP